MDSYLKIALICCGILLFLIILAIIAHFQNKKSAEKQRAKGIYTSYYNAKHVYGLPFPEDTRVNIDACKDHLSFSANNVSYDLAYNKIIDACVKTDVEIRSQTTSGAGGAVAGAMLFGPLGAVIGGRPKTKNTYDFIYYLLFTYMDKNGAISYMGFQVIKSDAKKLLNAIEPCIPKQKKNIEL